MIRPLLPAAALLLAMAPVTGALAADHKADANAINGIWESKSGGYVQIYPQGDHWVGTVVGSSSGKARYDENNPDPKLKGRRLLDVTLLKGLKYQGGNEWGDGSIYDPNNGKTYSAKATLTGPNTLEVRGYIGISLLGRSQDWHRISADAPHVRKKLLNDTGHSEQSAR